MRRFIAIVAALLPALALGAITRTDGPEFIGSSAASTNSATFNASAGDLVVVYASCNPQNSYTSSPVVSWNGGTPANATAFSQIGSKIGASVYGAIASGALAGVSVTVACSPSSGQDYPGGQVRLYSGANTSGTVAAAFGAVVTNSTLQSGAAQLSITPTATGSVLGAVFEDNNIIGSCSSAATGDTILQNTGSVGGGTAEWYSFEQTADTSNTSPTAIGCASPSSGLAWNGVAVEILAGPTCTPGSCVYTNAFTESLSLADAQSVPNATLYLRSTTTNSVGGGALDLDATRGGSATNVGVTDSSTGTSVDNITWTHYSDAALSANQTLNGTVTCNLRGKESATSVNKGVKCEVGYRRSGADTSICTSAASTEWTASETAKSLTCTASSVALQAGDLLYLKWHTVNVGTGASGTITQYRDGPTANATGDSYVTWPNCVNGITATCYTSSGTTYSDSFSDALSLGDALSAAGSTYNVTTSDALSPSDSLAHAQTMPNALSEAISPGDTLVNAATFPQAISESLSLGDSVAHAATWVATISETISLLDQLAHAQTANEVIAEALTLNATVLDVLNGGGTTYQDAISEALSLGDSYGAVAVYVATISEAITAAESLAARATYANSLSEAISLSDGATAQLMMAETLLEALTLGETVPSSAAYNEAMTEAMALGDGFSTLRTTSAAFTEALTLGDSLYTPGGGGTDPVLQAQINDLAARVTALEDKLKTMGGGTLRPAGGTLRPVSP